MNNYYVTFGQQYRREPHPKVEYAHPDGWLLIEAEDIKTAREKAFNELGDAWAFIYVEGGWDRSYFPLGELHRIS